MASTLSLRVAVPLRVRLHAAVSRTGRSAHATTYRSAHAIAVLKVTVASGVSVAMIAAGLRKTALVVVAASAVVATPPAVVAAHHICAHG